ncbi:Drug/metabolite transporter, partial [Aphelenchoides avenae]
MKKPTASPLFGAILLVIVHLVWVGTSEISKYLLTDLRFKRPIFMVFVRSIMWTCCFVLYFLRSTGEKRKSIKEVLFYFVYFAPPWMLSSMIGQVSIVFTSISAVFLIAASAPLFVLILATFTSQNVADHCSVGKLVLVLVNLGSVAVVSEFSPSVLGSVLALVSTICGAVYLTHVSAYQAKHGSVDMNLTI